MYVCYMYNSEDIFFNNVPVVVITISTHSLKIKGVSNTFGCYIEKLNE